MKIREWKTSVKTVCFMALLLSALGCLESASEALCEGDACERSTENREGYPGFGTNSGNIIAPLEFIDPEGAPFNLREVYENGQNQILLITTSAGWCTACIEEQASLQTLYDEYRERGVEIIVSVFQKSNYEPADARFAGQWKRRYRLTYPVVADPEFIMQDYYPGRDPSVTPILLVVDVDTMTIIQRFVGYDDIVVRALIDSQLSGGSQ